MKISKKLTSVITTCTVLAGLTGLIGCTTRESTIDTPKKETSKSYVASVPMWDRGSTAICTGDFDGNGTLDVIIITNDPKTRDIGRVYLLKNDGKGNFYQDTNESYD